MARGNINNLIKNSELTPQERKEKASKMGKASVKARKERKILRETMEVALKGEVEKGLTAIQAGVNATIKRWIETGDISILNGIRDLIGERPTDKIETTIKSTENQKLASEYLEALKNGQIKNKEKKD